MTELIAYVNEHNMGPIGSYASFGSRGTRV